MVRGNMTHLEKKNISPLIVQGVHERLIVQKIRDTKITSIFEFEWASQLRMYLEEDDI